MFEQVFANLQKATESTVKMQQEMVQKWVEAFPTAAGTGTGTPPTDADADVMKKWQEIAAEIAGEIVKRQKSILDQNYEAGLKSLKDVVSVAKAKSPQEYQEKVTQLYGESVWTLLKLAAGQVHEFRAAAEECTSLMTTGERLSIPMYSEHRNATMHWCLDKYLSCLAHPPV